MGFIRLNVSQRINFIGLSCFLNQLEDCWITLIVMVPMFWKFEFLEVERKERIWNLVSYSFDFLYKIEFMVLT